MGKDSELKLDLGKQMKFRENAAATKLIIDNLKGFQVDSPFRTHSSLRGPHRGGQREEDVEVC